MNIKDFIKQHRFEFSLYFTAGLLVFFSYLVIAKFMPIILSCRVLLD